MNLEREEVRTGALVFVTLTLFVAVLIYLGAPGVFVRQKTYWVYFDEAAGIQSGAHVTLAGRKIGQVRRLFSPVPESERPEPSLEVLVEVRVEAKASIYRQVKVTMAQPKLLGELVIDFSSGQEGSGLAEDGATFMGERQRGLSEAVPAVLEKIDPVLQRVTETIVELQRTAENLNRITAEDSELTETLQAFRDFGRNLNEMSTADGPLRGTMLNLQALTSREGKLTRVLENLDTLTSPESSLAAAVRHAERFTASLVNNRDLEVTLRNFRRASEKLDGTIADVSERFEAVGSNLEQGSDTLKRQPWRLIWPTTKKYPEDRKPERRAAPPTPRPSRPRR